MPLVTGLMNYLVPLQIGARDVSFPFLNNFSFWMTTAGAVLVMVSLFLGEFSTSRLAGTIQPWARNSPSTGLDYYIWALQIAGWGRRFQGINLIVTIIKMRAGHEPDEDARLHLDCPVHQRADRGLLPPC